MNRIKKTKLIYRFLLFILPLLILSIIMTGIILSWTSYNYFRKTINQDYGNIIKSSAGEIRFYMENAQKGLEGLALVIAAWVWTSQRVGDARATERAHEAELSRLEAELSTVQRDIAEARAELARIRGETNGQAAEEDE